MKISGYSDDGVDVDGVEGVNGADTAGAEDVHVEVEVGPVAGSGATIIVGMHYMTATLCDGCWEARLSRMEEGRPVIPAKVGEGSRGDHDVGVDLDVPHGTPVKVWKCTSRGVRTLVGEGTTV